MIRILLLTALFFTFPLFSLSMRERLFSAKEGSYVVFSQGGTTSLLTLQSQSDAYLIIEEISIPSGLSPKPGTFKDWIAKGAKGHTSWISYLISRSTGEIEEAYCFTTEKWLSTQAAGQFFSTLLKIDFAELPLENRRKIGPQPQGDGPDRRATWKPQLVRDGIPIKERSFFVGCAKWPKDGSDLSGKRIETYFDAKQTAFPFPLWLEVIDTSITYKLRAIDSGLSLKSPMPDTPLRPIEQIGPLQKEHGRISLTVRASSCHMPLSIELINASTGEVLPNAPSSFTQKDPHTLLVSIDTSSIPPSIAHFQLSVSPEGKSPLLSLLTAPFVLK